MKKIFISLLLLFGLSIISHADHFTRTTGFEWREGSGTFRIGNDVRIWASTSNVTTSFYVQKGTVTAYQIKFWEDGSIHFEDSKLQLSPDIKINGDAEITGDITGNSIALSSMTSQIIYVSTINSINNGSLNINAGDGTIIAGNISIDGDVIASTGTFNTIISTTITGVNGNFSDTLNSTIITDGTASLTGGDITGVGSITATTFTDDTATLTGGNITGLNNVETSTLTATNTVSVGTLTDGTATLTSGIISGLNDVQTTSATVTNTLNVGTLTDGTATLTNGSITGLLNVESSTITATNTITGGTLTDGTAIMTGGDITANNINVINTFSSEDIECNFLTVNSTSSLRGTVQTEDLRTDILTIGDSTGVVHAQWHFNESGGLTAFDSSGNSRNGTLQGSTPPTFVAGLLNNAISFGAFNDQYVDYGQIGIFDFDQKFSFSIWIKADLAGRARNIISKGDAGDGYAISIQADGDLEINLRDNASTRRIQLVLDTSLEDDAWHHIAVTYDGSYSLSGLTVKVDDGVPSTLASTDNLNIGDSMLVSNPFQVGALNGGTTYRDGLIDEVSVYEYELLAPSITQLYNSGSGTEDLPTGQNVIVIQKCPNESNVMCLQSRGNLNLASTNGNTDIYLSPGNNVGISTTTPTEKLHVNGTIKSEYAVIASTGLFSYSSGIALEITGGMLKTGCTAYGNNTDTHINLGDNCESGVNGQNYSNISIIKAVDSKAQEDGTHILGGDTIVITGRNSINVGGQDVIISGNGSTNIGSEDVDNAGLICATIAADNPTIESTAKFSVNFGKANELAGDYSLVGGQYMRSEGDNNFVWGFATSTEAISASNVAAFFPYGNAGKLAVGTGSPTGTLEISTGTGSTSLWVSSDSIAVGIGLNNPQGFLHIGDSVNGTYFEEDGTLVMIGDATVWEDLRFPATRIRQGATQKPDFDTDNVGLLFPQNDPAEIAYIIAQMPHSKLIGSDIEPHVHYIQTSVSTPTFKMDYIWIDIGESTGTWTTISSSTNIFTYTGGEIHQVMEFPTIPGSDSGVSSILSIKLYRDDNNVAGDVLVKEFDIHFQKNTLGSRTEYSK